MEEVYAIEDLENPDTLEMVLNIYSNKLIGFINSYVHDVNSAEDIMMDIFVELIIRKPKFSNSMALKGYLYRCAKNSALNYIKKHKRLTPLDEQAINDIYEIEKSICDSQIKTQIYNELKNLNDKYRMVLYLAYFEGLDDNEIAKAMSLNQKQVQNLKHRAKKKLNKNIEEKNIEF